jgi:hypothetical protein
MTLGVVMLLTYEAARPERWFWMWGENLPQANERAAGDQRLGGEIDNRIAERPALEDAGDAFQSPIGTPDREDESTEGRYFPGVQPEYLKSIRDDTILRRTETDAFYHLLRILAVHSERELTAASTGRVTYVQLFQQSNEYRGNLVSVRGTVRSAVQKVAPANDYGVGKYYELWVVPHDQPDTPLVVNCLELPKAFPHGNRLAQDAGITGFFFKRFAYQAADGRLHTTPLLLAKTIDWRPAAPAENAPAELSSFLWCFAVAGVFAFAVVIYVRRRSTRPPPSNLPDRVDWTGAV